MDAEAAVLAERLAGWSAAAEAELAERYRPGLVAVLRHRLGDVARAEDLCHETLRIAIEKLRAGALREPAKLAGYLWGIAKNLARRDRRTAGRRVWLSPGSELADPGDGPQERLLTSERIRLVRAVLDALLARDREILADFYLRDREKSQICARLGLSTAQFDVIKFRALRRFERLWKARLRPSGGG